MSSTTPSGTASPGLHELIEAIGSSDGAVREHARPGLVALGAAATPALLEALQARAWYTRWEAAKALSEIGDVHSAAGLVRALEDEDGSVRWIAAEGLINLGSAAAVPVLERLVLRSESVWLREGAHHVFGAISRGRLSDILKPVRDSIDAVNPRIGVITAADTALRQLQGG